MPLYFGRFEQMAVLPDPEPDVPLSGSRRVGEHTALGGGRSIDVTGYPRLDITLSWTRLPAAEAMVLEEFASGAAGPGPFSLLPVDAPGWNFLPAPVASATSITADTIGWTTDSTNTLSSVTTPVLRGPRALRWHLGQDLGNTRWLWIEWPPTGSMFPLGATGTWTWAFNARTLTGNVTVFAQLYGDGYHNGPDTVLGPNWTPVTVTYTPDSGENLAVFIGAKPGPAIEIIIDTPRLTYGSQVKAWTPGRGVPQVTITDFDSSAHWIDTYDVRMHLREIG